MPPVNNEATQTSLKKPVSLRKVPRPPHRLKHTRSKQVQKKPLPQQQQSIERFAAVTIRAIKANFLHSTFTRDDVLSLISQMRLDSPETWAANYGVNDVATQTRYRKVCDAVQHLLATGELASLDWLRLCLPNMHQKLSQEVPPQILYLPTVRRVITQNFKPGSILDVMAVVRLWRSDQHIPENIKRMVVRGVFPLLARERLLRRGEYRQFMVREV